MKHMGPEGVTLLVDMSPVNLNSELFLNSKGGLRRFAAALLSIL